MIENSTVPGFCNPSQCASGPGQVARHAGRYWSMSPEVLAWARLASRESDFSFFVVPRVARAALPWAARFNPFRILEARTDGPKTGTRERDHVSSKLHETVANICADLCRSDGAFFFLER